MGIRCEMRTRRFDSMCVFRFNFATMIDICTARRQSFIVYNLHWSLADFASNISYEKRKVVKLWPRALLAFGMWWKPNGETCARRNRFKNIIHRRAFGGRVLLLRTLLAARPRDFRFLYTFSLYYHHRPQSIYDYLFKFSIFSSFSFQSVCSTQALLLFLRMDWLNKLIIIWIELFSLARWFLPPYLWCSQDEMGVCVRVSEWASWIQQRSRYRLESPYSMLHTNKLYLIDAFCNACCVCNDQSTA